MRPSRIRDRSSSASTSPASLRTCPSSDATRSRTGSGAPTRSTTFPSSWSCTWSAVTGVRSSWEATERNSSRARTSSLACR